MNNSAGRELNTPLDSLDLHHEEFNRSKMFQISEPKEELVFKNFYKQQLDQVLQQKNQYKSLQKQKQQQERRTYNERLRLAQQAERIKQLSYKNYYQMIMNNQDNIKNKYISPFQQRDEVKNKLINRGMEEGRIRSQIQYDKQVRRQQNIKRQFQTVLGQQIKEKDWRSRNDFEEKTKNNEHIRNVLLTPHEIQRLQRERKLTEMNKYKQDLDKLKNQKYNLSQSQLNNSYNPQQITKSPSKGEKHDLLLNPMPFNIQNPYILRQMQKKSLLISNPSYKTISQPNSYSPTRRNIF